jgi:preprotein translocase subunit SecD
MRWLLPLALIAVAAAPADVLTIAGERFPQSDIIDARAVGDANGPAILVTLGPAATKRLATITRANVGRPITVALGAKVIAAPVVMEPIEAGSFQISGQKSFPEAAAMARRISGKAPLPESEGE